MKYLEAKALAGQKALRPQYEDKALKGAPEDKNDPLDGVEFASPAARTVAEEAGLTAAAFKGAQPSSERGFTADDVREILASKQPE